MEDAENISASKSNEGERRSATLDSRWSEQRLKKIVPILLCFIVGLGLFMRIWGIGWSLPDQRHPLATYHPDERINLSAAQSVDIGHLNFDTHFYNYGTFYFYLVSLSQTIGQTYGWIPKTQASPELSPIERMQRTQPELAGLFLAGRVVTALMGTLTILILYLLGKQLYNRQTGLLAALLYAIAPLAAVHSHYLTVDVPVTLFVTLALWQSARIVSVISKRDEVVAPQSVKLLWREVLFSGVWVGLAGATKYTAATVLIAPVVSIILLNKKPLEPSKLPKTPVALVALFGVAVLTFLIACPGVWLNWHSFWEGEYPGSGLRYELFEHSRSGHGLLFVHTGLGWVYHLTVSAPYGLGIPLLLLTLLGIGLAFFRRTPGDWILLIFLLLSFGLTGLSAVRFARYLIPLFPALCLLGARVTLEPYCTKILRRIFLVFGLFVILITFVYSFSLVRAFTIPDPRDVAYDYLNHTAHMGASVAFSRTPWFFSPPLSVYFGAPNPQTRASAGEHTTRYQLRIPSQEWDVSLLTTSPDYVILSSFETQQEVNRLHLPTTTPFLDFLKMNYSVVSFAPPVVFGLNRQDPNLPEDLLYDLPVILIYEKK